MTPSSENTPHREFTRALQEVAELREEITVFDHSASARHKVASEAADVIIGMYGVGQAVGVDLEEIIRDKVVFTTQVKYPAEAIQKRMQDGLTWHQAMDIQKHWSQRWQKHT